MIGLVGVLAELGAGDHRGPLVEEADQRAEQPGLALAALAEQDDVVAGEQRALDLRDHGVGEPVETRPRVEPSRSRASRLSRSSSRSGLSWWPLSRSWPRVLGSGCWVLLIASVTLHARPVRQRRVRSKPHGLITNSRPGRRGTFGPADDGALGRGWESS